MRKRKLLPLAVVVALIGGAFYVYGLMRRGWSTRTPPSQLETLVARTMHEMASARKQQNPWKASPDVIDAGRSHRADHSATCHGSDGSGNTTIGANLYPRPPDMRQVATQNLTDGELYFIT